MWFITAVFVLLVLGTIDAAPKNKFGSFSRYNTYEDSDNVIGEKVARNFGLLKLGGGYGIAKRYPPTNLSSDNKFETKNEKHRRGPLNGLIPGGAFGRAARSYSNCLNKDNSPASFNCEKIIKALRTSLDVAELPPYFSFDVESSRTDSGDGQGMKAFIDKTSQENIDAYTPYQYKQLFDIE